MSFKLKLKSFINTIIISSFYYLSSTTTTTVAQQPYAKKATTNCGVSSNSTSVLGYTCNGLNPTCQSYLIFRSQPPYNTVSSISTLLSADPLQVSAINSVSESSSFVTNKEVIVPVNCSCTTITPLNGVGNNYYQANTSYVVANGDTYSNIANTIFQSLSTCHALQDQNKYSPTLLFTGVTINVPLRCACPTKNQTDAGVKYLLTYIVSMADSVDSVSTRFRVNTSMTLEANELTQQDSTIFSLTTLLIPLQTPPTSSDTVVPPPPSPPPLGTTSPPPTKKGSSKRWVFIVVGALAGIAFLSLICVTIFCIFFCKSSKEKKSGDPVVVSESFESCERPLNKQEMEESQEFYDSISSIAQSVKVYTYKELQSATDNFSPESQMKGTVYRGRFNKDFAAIKRMNGDVSKEIALLNKINHFNLVKLSGFCRNGGNWYLVYEYAANGSLNDWIYTNSRRQNFLNWTQRVQIALDVATGLNYLHSYTVPSHVHKDVQSCNILLDSEFRAKIANFGLARSAEGQDGQFALTRHIVGTQGYMAPEYLENGLVSTMLDVYAFGILLYEIVTGKVAADLDRKNVILTLSYKEDEVDKFRDFVDSSLKDNYPLELAVLLVKTIADCLQKDPASRPTMDEIMQNLRRVLNASLNWELSNNAALYQSYDQTS